MSSCLVLHMSKFRREAVRGIQGHNQRERKSQSNPDIVSERSNLNYDLHNGGKINYQKVINNRIDSLDLKRAPRHDAVQMCGLIVSSNQKFFENLNAFDQRRFFQAASDWLSEFVGPENVIAAHVHLDEKTPHLHFCHVPITPDGRLCAKEIYTRANLKKMQEELPKYLQSQGFAIDRGVKQESGSAKKHLDTREFKQQQTALENLRKESDLEATKLDALQEKINALEKIASEAEKILAEKPELPSPGLFKAQAIHEAATNIISHYQKSLADKKLVEERNKFLEKSQATVDEQICAVEEKAAQKIRQLVESAKNRENELKGQLQQAVKIINQRDQNIKNLMVNIDKLLVKNNELQEIEKKWRAQQEEERFKVLRQKKKESLAPKSGSVPTQTMESQRAPAPSQPQPTKKPDQGLSR